MARFLCYCLCVVFSLPALAFPAERVVVVEPGQITRTYTPGQSPYAFNDSRSWKEPVSTQSGRVNVPVKTDRKYGFPSFRAGLKNALKINPARVIGGAVVAGAVGAVGWVMDQSTGQLKKPEYSFDSSLTLFWCGEPSAQYCTGSHALNRRFASPADAKPVLDDFYCSQYGSSCATGSVTSTMTVDASQATYLWSFPVVGQTYKISGGSNLYRHGSCSSGFIYVPATGKCQSHQPTSYAPVTDSDIDQLTAGITSPGDAASIAPDVIEAVPGSYDYPDGFDFSGPDSITGDPVVTTTTTPSGTEVSTTTPSYSFDYSTNPLSITTTTTNTTTVYNNGTLVSTSTTTNNQGVVDASPEPSSEVPTDCEFMPTVCEFIAWFKTPTAMPEPDLPVPVDDEFKQTYSASFGGSCPAPRQVHTDNFGTLSISWDPICQLAFYIKFLVVGGAALYAAYIGLGISRGNA